jgi:hypothetical protein
VPAVPVAGSWTAEEGLGVRGGGSSAPSSTMAMLCHKPACTESSVPMELLVGGSLREVRCNMCVYGLVQLAALAL